MKTFAILAGAVLLALSSAAPSQARQAAKRVVPQGDPGFYDQDYNNTSRRDSSCFNSTGLPEQYACSSHGG